jgi:hypothetical protein
MKLPQKAAHLSMKALSKKTLHRTAIPLRAFAADELGRC